MKAISVAAVLSFVLPSWMDWVTIPSWINFVRYYYTRYPKYDSILSLSALRINWIMFKENEHLNYFERLFHLIYYYRRFVQIPMAFMLCY